MGQRKPAESLAIRMLRAESRIGVGDHYHDGRNDESLEPVDSSVKQEGSGWVEYTTDADGHMHVMFHDGDVVEIGH